MINYINITEEAREQKALLFTTSHTPTPRPPHFLVKFQVFFSFQLIINNPYKKFFHGLNINYGAKIGNISLKR